jgi:hypothetical protein
MPEEYYSYAPPEDYDRWTREILTCVDRLRDLGCPENALKPILDFVDGVNRVRAEP